MRIVLLGASEEAVHTAKLLIDQGHEVILVEAEKARIDELSEDMDCSFLHGDGARPAVLKEVGPKHTDVLCCLTNNDQANIIATLVGRSLGFKRVITSIQDPDLEPICQELGLDNTIIPSRTTSRYLSDLIREVNTLELSTIIKDEARFFSFTVSKQNSGSIKNLELPEEARVVCMYRKGKFTLVDEKATLSEGDEVVILTHSKYLTDLKERFRPKQVKQKNDKDTTERE